MATQNFLCLDEGLTKTTYKLHPVVVFSILDHYKRRNETQGRVVGTLLGQRDEHNSNVVYVRDCYPVRHNQTSEDQVVVDMTYHEKMLELHQRVNKKAQVVGWYSTGKKPDYISSLIHEAYQTEVSDIVGDFVHVSVDVELSNDRLGIQAYTRKSIKVGSKPVLARFEPVHLQYNAYEAEKIGVEALINGDPEEGGLDAPAVVLSDVESYTRSLRKLLKSIDSVKEYCSKVEGGQVGGDPELGAELREALWSVPQYDPADLDAVWNDSVQDLLMSVYLSNLTKAHIAMADKVNALLA